MKLGDDAERQMVRTEAIIQSMTLQERRKPELLNGSRRQRIANGAGVKIADVNQLLKQFQQMQKMMKMMKGGGSEEDDAPDGGDEGQGRISGDVKGRAQGFAGSTSKYGAHASVCRRAAPIRLSSKDEANPSPLAWKSRGHPTIPAGLGFL